MKSSPSGSRSKGWSECILARVLHFGPQDSMEEPMVESAGRPAVSPSIAVAVAGVVVSGLIFCSDIVLHPNVQHNALNTAIAASPPQNRVTCFTRSAGSLLSFEPLGARLGG